MKGINTKLQNQQPIINMDNYVPLEVYENLKEKFLEKEGEIDDRNTQIRNLEE